MRIFLPIILSAMVFLRGGLVAQGPCEDIDRVGVGWWANWEVVNRCPDARAEFVPHVCWCFHYVPEELPEGTVWAMGPNETNMATCDMSPERAAAFMQALNEAFPDVRWVSPSVAACRPSEQVDCLVDPFEWMDQYMALCPDCQDALAVHWYPYQNIPLEPYLDKMAEYGLPLWLTEWGCDTMDCAIRSYEVIEPRVARHAWFALRLTGWDWPISDQTLVDPNTGKLTGLGKWYRGLK